MTWKWKKKKKMNDWIGEEEEVEEEEIEEEEEEEEEEETSTLHRKKRKQKGEKKVIKFRGSKIDMDRWWESGEMDGLGSRTTIDLWAMKQRKTQSEREFPGGDGIIT